MEALARAFAEQRGLRFHNKVGAGAYKETFLVETNNGDLLALKVISNKSSPGRTQREIDAILRCDHPNIASLRTVDKFDHEGVTVTCLLEDFLAGGTLRERINIQKVDRAQAIQMAKSLIRVLAHIWPHRLVHRDIKPENIMFRSAESWDPIVVDFGLVRDLSKSSLTQSWSPIGPGTPLYAPPEQLNNRKEMIDWRSDQFSLAITLVDALGGAHPYSSPSDTGYECVDRVAATSEPDSAFANFIDQQQLPVLAKMVKPYPVQRFRTPEVLLQAWSEQ